MPISAELRGILDRIPFAQRAREKEDYLLKLPDLSDVPDKMRLSHIYCYSEFNLEARLLQAGLTKGQRAAVSNALSAAQLIEGHWLTVGEVRELTNGDLMKFEGVGPRTIRILRTLFSSHQEGR